MPASPLLPPHLHPSGRPFEVADFDFHLPPELIAQHPAAERTGSRLLDGRGRLPADRRFAELPSLLQAGDLLVFNDTRVIKARLFGEKPTGGSVEALVERVLPAAQPGGEPRGLGPHAGQQVAKAGFGGALWWGAWF